MSLINTRLQNFRSANPQIDRFEYRNSENGAWETFMAQTRDPMGIITPDLTQKAIRAIGSTLEIPVIDFEATTIQNVTQPLVVVGGPSTSQLLAVTFVDYYFGFLIHPAQHFNNEISMQREFNQQMRRYVVALANEWDQAAITAIEAAKNQVAPNLLGARYTFAGDTIQGPLAEADNMVGDIDIFGNSLDFTGPYDIIGARSLQSHVNNNLKELGEFNQRDKTQQWQNKTWRFSNNVTDAAGQRYTGYAIQKGTIGALFQYGADNVMGNSSSNHQWGIEPIPGLGANMGTYTYDGAANGTALSGAATAHLTATLQQAYGFHNRVALVVSYNSDRAAIPSPQYKFQIATT